MRPETANHALQRTRLGVAVCTTPIMKKTTIILIATLALVTGCFRLGIRGDGVIKTEDRPISNFSKVEVTGGYEIKWSGGKPALTITTDQNLLPLIATVVSGDTLQIGSTNNLSPTKG